MPHRNRPPPPPTTAPSVSNGAFGFDSRANHSDLRLRLRLLMHPLDTPLSDYWKGRLRLPVLPHHPHAMPHSYPRRSKSRSYNESYGNISASCMLFVSFVSLLWMPFEITSVLSIAVPFDVHVVRRTVFAKDCCRRCCRRSSFVQGTYGGYATATATATAIAIATLRLEPWQPD